MTTIEDLKQRLKQLNLINRLDVQESSNIRDKFPGIPGEYIEFLSVIGFGNLEELQLYSAPARAGSIYTRPKMDLSNIVLFGDDFQGYCYGFDTSNGYSLVEVDPRGNLNVRTPLTFLEFIASYFPD